MAKTEVKFEVFDNFPTIINTWKKTNIKNGAYSYYLNEQGLLAKYASVGKRCELAIPHIKITEQRPYYNIYKKNKKTIYYVEDLYSKLYNDPKNFDCQWFFWAKQQTTIINEELKKIQQPKSSTRKKYNKTTKYSRTCHDCGKPTNNFRCDECWQKIRQRKKELEGEFYGIGDIDLTYSCSFNNIVYKSGYLGDGLL